jgi:pyruvate/2-oxoacid:ferredoxin oxidoreductase alpha subunit/pyruvate/2-oxoacid:ferredoxin oxidoreductase beta subunit/Pyruvate/2-oxoacid:ferredoxin oxidoreductase delta subunit
LESPSARGGPFWLLFTAAAHILAERSVDPARFDDYGDFLRLGAPSIVHRHATERLRKHISQKVVYDPRLCTQCLRCVTLCNEMKVMASETGAQILGPSEDHCTNCGLCQKRCSFLAARPKAELELLEQPRHRIGEGGAAVHLYGSLADEFIGALETMQTVEATETVKSERTADVPYRTRTLLDVPPDLARSLPIGRQILLQAASSTEPTGQRDLLVTTSADPVAGHSQAVIRTSYRAALVLQTEEGTVEKDLALIAMKLGVHVQPVVDAQQGAISVPSNDTTRLFRSLGHPAITGRSLPELWAEREADLFLAPYADKVSADLHQRIVQDTGRQAQILAPHIPQALPFTQNPLLGRLNKGLSAVFMQHPELMEAEAGYAGKLLENIPVNSSLLHARYRSMAFGSGHTACPTCAEAQVLAIPVYMAMAMSFARKEVPQVYFTCETGCMSETLNKVNEVAQKVPGGRTVFGGGFAFGEAIAMAQDRSVRMGLLKKGRRYVVSQGGDGGAVIGLPAWLNALRQQAFLFRQRNPNVLHFINITDTQVYSNTGGESSASSLLGMGTLTTPIGQFLLGNQNIQWTLINLAAEFPGVLVGAGHSANRTAMQQFWQLADQTGQSAIRWDVTPCPETGKFFGEDPDDLAEVMAHAGMIPEIVFVGRFRKRIAPFQPEDRSKPYGEWDLQPKPIEYWLLRDPRYRSLFRKNPQTGKQEPRNLTAHFIISQLASYRDQINWQIDLETRQVRRAEEWVTAFIQELKETWSRYRYRLEQFPYAMLFNRSGELKPEYAVSLEQEMVRRILGWDEMVRYTGTRDRALAGQQDQTERFLSELEKLEGLTIPHPPDSGITSAGRTAGADWVAEMVARLHALNEELKQQANTLRRAVELTIEPDPVEQELFPPDRTESHSLAEKRREALHDLLDRILEERGLACQVELQQHRLSQQLKRKFLEGGGLIRQKHAVSSLPDRQELLGHIKHLGPFSVGVASLAGDRGIAINRIFANFFTAKGAWAGMAWQFGSSKRGTPVLSATFVDSRPLHRKDAMHSLPVAVLTVVSYEDMKRQPDLFFAQLRPGGFLIINHGKNPEALWRELLDFYPQDIRSAVLHVLELELENGKARSKPPSADAKGSDGKALDSILEAIARELWGMDFPTLTADRKREAGKIAAILTVRMITLDMDRIMRDVTGSPKVVSNLVAVAPMFQALSELGFHFDWSRDLTVLTQGFPEAVLKNPSLLNHYYKAMEQARKETLVWSPLAGTFDLEAVDGAERRSDPVDAIVAQPGSPDEGTPADYLLIMGGTLAGMVLSQIATAEHPLFYVGFPITPAGNPFYAMAEAFANGHPYIVVDEVNPSEKVAAEKLMGIGRNGGFLPVTFTASQGWRLFTEIIPQFVGARLEALFLIAKRALAAPNLNIEESHTDFMSFRDDGGIMLAPKSIQEYVPALYLSRLLTHFARLPVILSIGGITDTHKIGLVKVPSDNEVRAWLKKALKDFDFLEDKLINRQGDLVVHGPSGTSAVYQETQSELEKAHQAVKQVYPHALRTVHELTGVWLDELEVVTATPHEKVETLLVLEGSLFPNAVEALQGLEEIGWLGLACVSVRSFNPFPEEKFLDLFKNAKRIVVMDRSNSFGSIPPLASRVFTALARFASFKGAGDRKILRTLVGGLGGREITVDEMREILLSTHLLFQAPEAWEAPLIEKWVEEDDVLAAHLHEAAALAIRNTDRHTRVPPHLRTHEDRKDEYRDHLDQLKRSLIEKSYPAFLANYNQVEFIGAREILQETALLQQIVLYLETRLASHAIETKKSTWRHPLILFHYGSDALDRKKVEDAMRQEVDARRLSPVLASHYGMLAGKDALGFPVEAGEPVVSGPVAPWEIELDPAAERLPPERDLGAPKGPSPHDVGTLIAFAPEEAALVEAILTDLVTRQGEEPLFYNPEDYEYALLTRLRSDPRSSLFQLQELVPPGHLEDLVRQYQICYRNVIDRTLQREVLTQHHAPELREIFEGEGRKRLEELVARMQSHFAEETEEARRKATAEEVERYLSDRCLPAYPKTSLFYLDYYRNWIADDLLKGLAPRSS